VLPELSSPTPDTVSDAATLGLQSDQVKKAWYWIKDTKGYGSVTVTLVFIAFWVTTITYIASMFASIGPITLRPFDVGACTAYMGPILATYVGRKWTDAKYGKTQ
jgi:hypothetical protein